MTREKSILGDIRPCHIAEPSITSRCISCRSAFLGYSSRYAFQPGAVFILTTFGPLQLFVACITAFLYRFGYILSSFWYLLFDNITKAINTMSHENEWKEGIAGDFPLHKSVVGGKWSQNSTHSFRALITATFHSPAKRHQSARC